MAEKRPSSELTEQPMKSKPRRELEAAGPDDAVDRTIASIETLYRSLTGNSPPSPGERPYAPIPVERNPEEYVAGQMERLSSALGAGGSTPAAGLAWSPPAAVWEDDRELVVCLDLPGVGPECVEVAMDGSLLSVFGTRPERHDGHRLRLREGPHGPFARRFALPPRVADAETRALMADGILEVHLTKSQSETPGPRRVPIA